MKPRPRRLEPEEEEEFGIKEEVDAHYYGYSSVEEKRAHEQQMIDDLRMMELEEEEEENRRAYEQQMLEDLGLDGMSDPDRDDEWDWGEW